MNKILFVVIVSLSLCLSTLFASDKSGVLYERWSIEGNKVQDLTSHSKYKKTANFALYLRKLQRYDSAENFGARFSALVQAPRTGEYRFYLSSDDGGELWLSNDEDPANLKKIAFVSGYTGKNVWSASPSQESKPINLEVGEKYYIRVIHKQGTGKDHVEVGWEGPRLRFEIIPLKALFLPEIDAKTTKLIAKCMTLMSDSKETFKKMEELPYTKLVKFVLEIPKDEVAIIATQLGKIAIQLKQNPSSKNMKLAENYYNQSIGILPTKRDEICNPILKQMLYIESVYIKNLSLEKRKWIGSHRTAPVMGDIADVQPKNGQVILSSKSSKGRDYELICTGFYALPGKMGQISVPNELASQKMKLQLGHHLDAPKARVKSLYSMPETTITEDITSITTDFVTPYGGLIFIKVPKGVWFKDQIFKVSGAIKAPRFVLGETTNKEWQKIRNYPGPWGELIADRIVFIIPSYILKTVNNPTELMDWWNKNLIRQEEFYGYNINMPFRMHVSYYPIRGCSTWPLYETEETILANLNLKSLKAFNLALFLHEHGHHADNSKMMFQNMGESTPNWGGYYIKGIYCDFNWKDSEEAHMMRLFDANDEMHTNIKKNKWWQTKWTHYWSYPITSVMLGYVQGFGWSALKSCVHRFNNAGDHVNKLSFCSSDGVGYGSVGNLENKNQAVMDKWLIFMSEEAKMDVTPYMGHFFIKPSSECRRYLDKKKYKKWDLVYLPQRPVLTEVNQTVTLRSPLDYLLTMSKNVKFEWSGKPLNGTLTNEFTYTPKKGFSGEDQIPLVLTDRYGNSQKSVLKIKVLPKKKMPNMYVAVLSSVTTGKWSRINFSQNYIKPVVLTGIIPSGQQKEADGYIVRIRDLTAKGFEVTIQSKELANSEKKVVEKSFAISLAILESGEFSLNETGIRAEIGSVNLKPETISAKMKYQLKDLDNNWPALRDTAFGQVLSSKNSEWSAFFSGSIFEKRAKAIGVYGYAKSFSEAEDVGYAFIKTGYYQIGKRSIKITSNSITVDNSTLNLNIPNVKRLQRKANKR